MMLIFLIHGFILRFPLLLAAGITRILCICRIFAFRSALAFCEESEILEVVCYFTILVLS